MCSCGAAWCSVTDVLYLIKHEVFYVPCDHLEVFGQRRASETSTRFGHEDTLALLECQLQPSGLAYSHLKHTFVALVRSLISVNAHCRVLFFVADERMYI